MGTVRCISIRPQIALSCNTGASHGPPGMHFREPNFFHFRPILHFSVTNGRVKKLGEETTIFHDSASLYHAILRIGHGFRFMYVTCLRKSPSSVLRG